MREKLNKWWRGFVDKQKLALLDGDDNATRWYMYISPARVLVGLVTLVVVVIVAVTLLFVYTPVLDTIPGYPGKHSREALIRGIMRLDSLEREMANLTVYTDNIGLIMEGKTPFLRDVTTQQGDSVQMQDKTLVPRNGADSLLRAEMEGEGEYSLAASAAAARSNATSDQLVPPIKGIVQSEFSPVDGRFGVEIATSDQSPVVAARDGTVTLSVWTPGEGYLIQIQHSDNLLSVYRRLTEAQASVGSRVKAGEIIGMAGPLVFELWYNGTAVNPLNYIVF
jgi:murein DD-endopeptidase MepM/ murein hydrolase activator NlpD